MAINILRKPSRALDISSKSQRIRKWQQQLIKNTNFHTLNEESYCRCGLFNSEVDLLLFPSHLIVCTCESDPTKVV